jgi:hypothetical protein
VNAGVRSTVRPSQSQNMIAHADLLGVIVRIFHSCRDITLQSTIALTHALPTAVVGSRYLYESGKPDQLTELPQILQNNS